MNPNFPQEHFPEKPLVVARLDASTYIDYNTPCYIDQLPSVRKWWPEDDPDADPYPGIVETTAQFLEDCNYHDFVTLPYAFKTIVKHTPLKADQKQILLERLCTALFNFDRLRGVEE